MIKLSSRPECPPVLKSTKVRKTRSALRKKVREGNKLSSSDFKGKSYWGETKQTLHEYQHKKCCYCERRRDANAEADVEHFRPKLGVTENPEHPGYWWLAYEWSNLLFVCKACNSDHKKNQFPLLQETDRVFTPDDDLSAEKPVLINPSLEDPADFIDYDWESIPGKVLMVGKDAEDRGWKTIKILALNSDRLSPNRLDTLLALEGAKRILRSPSPQQAEHQDAVERLKQKAAAHQECLGLVRCYISRQGLQEFLQ